MTHLFVSGVFQNFDVDFWPLLEAPHCNLRAMCKMLFYNLNNCLGF